MLCFIIKIWKSIDFEFIRYFIVVKYNELNFLIKVNRQIYLRMKVFYYL